MQMPKWLNLIQLPMPATLGQVNVYLIRGPHGVALVDTGMDDASSRRQLQNELASHGLSFGDVDTLVCTHHHVDHAGLGRTFGEAGTDTMMSLLDMESLKAFFENPELDETRAAFYGKHEVPDDFAARVSRMFPFFRSLSEEFEPKTVIEDNQIVDMAGIEFRVLLTPGHTRGHVCLLQEEAQVVFTGDCVITREATHISMRPEAMGTDPLGGFIGSLDRLHALGALAAYPGHGNPFSNLAERCDEILSHHRTRLEQTEAALTDELQTAFAISGVSMGARPRAFARWLAVSQTLAYLEHLVRLNRAQAVETGSGLRYRLASDG
jgi:glyoxylase-like metal-dependent hydrolase (beta-lactamase superfamily II)